MEKVLIDCSKRDFKYVPGLSGDITVCDRGSYVYGTWNPKKSDIDILMIVPDETEFINDLDVVKNDMADKRIHNMVIDGTGEPEDFTEFDLEIVRKSDFIDMINEHHPLALEALFLSKEHVMNGDGITTTLTTPITVYINNFKLDKWKLRQVFGGIASNSWVKSKKKLTVEKDYDVRCAIKSLFHSIRLMVYACQIAEYGRIVDYTGVSSLWNDIEKECLCMEGKSGQEMWDFYKDKYKPIWNKWHSKMVDLCPRP